ncbi:anti-sigma B factor antagonist [Maridesulfovibrio ferrireducens]|uniref:Anti-sigma factor antagonist n=1 Tax=Maridesulfovibrio ferrireducens TaxID=246191 RepID=A0A1G9H0D9_9BACT|nr:STAS domain-containing protein [Maridesulfovibrio ferrireducens]SDL06324.1 anti-sigma B factor antagonist [Maridesulfovibrio ferrireducens]
MNLSHERAGSYLIIAVNEPRVDSSNFTHLKSSLGDIIAQGERNLIINLSQVRFMDSSGIAGLLPSVHSLAGNGNIFLVGLTAKVLQLFNLSKLDSIFDIYPSVEEALKN